MTRAYKGHEKARLAWNTRAPILSAEEMEELSYGQFTTKPN